MKLYSVAENGALRRITKLQFADNAVYLVDDYKNLYLWFGQKASKKKKELSKKKANILNEKRGKSANIQILDQGNEFGGFLAVMDLLKKGLKKTISIEKRPELELQYEDTLELIDAGLEPDLEAEITVTAHKLLEEKKTYEYLCEKLAEIQIKILTDKDKVSEAEIKKKSEEIHKSSSTYEELCWLIAELSTLIKKKSFVSE